MSYGYRTPRRPRSRAARLWDEYGFIAVIVAVIAAVVLVALAWVAAVKGSQRDVTVFVKDKERVCSSTGQSCKYLIYTDHGTFENTDSLIYMKFSSSDVYGNIDRNKTYTFKVVGWRLPFFSAYPNIVKVEK